MLRLVSLAVGVVLAASPVRADEFNRRFTTAADLAGLKIVSGDWGVKDRPDPLKFVSGAYVVSSPAGGLAAFSVTDVSTRTLRATMTWSTAPQWGAAREFGVVVGDPNGGGTRPSYYASVKDAYFAVGQVTSGFLDGAPRLQPTCVNRVASFGTSATMLVSLGEKGLLFMLDSQSCTVSVSASRPVGMLSVFAARDDPKQTRGPNAGLTWLSVTGDGAAVAKTHADPRLRRHIRGLMD